MLHEGISQRITDLLERISISNLLTKKIIPQSETKKGE
jgi:hypothetical protein